VCAVGIDPTIILFRGGSVSSFWMSELLEQARLTFYAGLHEGNMKFNKHNEERMSICIILPLYFSIHHVHSKYAEYRKKLCKMQSQHNYGVAIFSTFLQK
jgi:hypothetical protein